MGNNDNNSLRTQQLTLTVIILFGILFVLILLLIAISLQTWALWKLARSVVESNTESDGVRRRSSAWTGTLGERTLVGHEEGKERLA
ncbi:hypothetical protein PSPO01_05198 [Paraphaeosphaeria sporulosa]